MTEVDFEIQVDRNIKLTNEKIRLEAELKKLNESYTDLCARFNTLQDLYWKLQDRHMAVQEALMSTVTINNLRDYGEKPAKTGEHPW